MKQFWGKSYLCQGTEIGICELHGGLFKGMAMLYFVDGEYLRPVWDGEGTMFWKPEDGQSELDEYARLNGLVEARK